MSFVLVRLLWVNWWKKYVLLVFRLVKIVWWVLVKLILVGFVSVMGVELVGCRVI